MLAAFSLVQIELSLPPKQKQKASEMPGQATQRLSATTMNERQRKAICELLQEQLRLGRLVPLLSPGGGSDRAELTAN